MKRRGEDLSKHYRQAFDYWTRLVPGRPRYVVLCNFGEFWVYDFETQMDLPVDKVQLTELPERWGPLAFLFPTAEKPVFGNDHQEVTRKAADRLATCFNKLIARKVERGLAQRFTLQTLVALFAEDIGLLEQYTLTKLLEECKKPEDSYDLLGGLFEAMNTPGKTQGGRFKGVDYFNGGLFRSPHGSSCTQTSYRNSARPPGLIGPKVPRNLRRAIRTFNGKRRAARFRGTLHKPRRHYEDCRPDHC